jgi:hypothetical protein
LLLGRLLLRRLLGGHLLHEGRRLSLRLGILLLLHQVRYIRLGLGECGLLLAHEIVGLLAGCGNVALGRGGLGLLLVQRVLLSLQ